MWVQTTNGTFVNLAYVVSIEKTDGVTAKLSDGNSVLLQADQAVLDAQAMWASLTEAQDFAEAI